MLLLACASPPPPGVEASVEGVVVRGEVEAVQVLEAGGVPVTQRSEGAGDRTQVPVALQPGSYVVRVWRAGAPEDHAVVVAAPAPYRVEAYLGEGWVAAEEEVAVPLVGPGHVRLAVVAGPSAPPRIPTSLGDDLVLDAPGVRVTRDVPLAPGERRVVTLGERSLVLRGVALDRDQLLRDVRLEAVVFPVDGAGAPQLGKARQRVTLVAPWWRRVSNVLGLVTRARDAWSPWAYAAVRFRNDGAAPVDLVVTLSLDHPAFRPHLRAAEGNTGVVRGLLRVPAGSSAVAALPVFVDEATVPLGEHPLKASATLLGTSEVGWTAELPLYVREGSTGAVVGLVGGALISLGGYAWVGRRLSGWLARAATSELMTIALFGAVLFGVGSASDVVSMAVGAVLGPFATLLTGLLQDVLRVALLGTLVTLLPRPGTLALATLTGAIGRALTTGGLSPTDLVYLGASVALAEGFAWVAGLTRGGAWRDGGPGARWLRLSLAFGGANVLQTGIGLALHIVLFRLYFADWYIALQLLGPGFLYVLVASALAVPFAASLRRVET